VRGLGFLDEHTHIEQLRPFLDTHHRVRVEQAEVVRKIASVVGDFFLQEAQDGEQQMVAKRGGRRQQHDCTNQGTISNDLPNKLK